MVILDVMLYSVQGLDSYDGVFFRAEFAQQHSTGYEGLLLIKTSLLVRIRSPRSLQLHGPQFIYCAYFSPLFSLFGAAEYQQLMASSRE